jgi:hypothetical protein
VLPYSKNAPTQTSQCSANYLIARLVSAKFARPKHAIGDRKATVSWTGVPKTTIYKNGETCGGENEVGLAKNRCAAAPSSNAKLSKDSN